MEMLAGERQKENSQVGFGLGGKALGRPVRLHTFVENDCSVPI